MGAYLSLLAFGFALGAIFTAAGFLYDGKGARR